MVFMQLNRIPNFGIPDSDSYCFGKLTDRIGNLAPIYQFRDHPHSNTNNGGWEIQGANKTSFKLQLIF